MSAVPDTAFADMVSGMRSRERAPGVSVLRHGLALRDRYLALVAHLREGAPLPGGWRPPPWARDPLATAGLPPDVTVARYLAFHACGPEGDPASSESAWLAAGGEPEVGRLIGMHGDVAALREDDLDGFSARPQARALLLAALCAARVGAALPGATGPPGGQGDPAVRLDRVAAAVMDRIRNSEQGREVWDVVEHGEDRGDREGARGEDARRRGP